MSPMELCRRVWLYQPIQATTASSSARRLAEDAVGDQFGLEGVDEAFGQGVVVGVADGADAGQHLAVVEHLLELAGGVLRAGVRVVHELHVGAAAAGG